MAIQYITPADQGYQHKEGNLLDAATSAMALYNLPQSVKLAMERQRLQNQGMGLQNTGKGIENATNKNHMQWESNAANLPGTIAGAIPQNTLPTPYKDSGKPADNGITSPPLAFGPKTSSSPGSIGDSSGNMYANTNQNSSNGGITNDLNVKGTSAEEMPHSIDPYNSTSTTSILHASQAQATSGGMPNNAPTQANGTSARGNSQLPPTIPGSTQGGGPLGSPFNSSPTTKGTSFNSGNTADNSSSQPRDGEMVSKKLMGPKGASLQVGDTIFQHGKPYTVGE